MSDKFKETTAYLRLLGKYARANWQINMLKGLLYIELRKYNGQALKLTKKLIREKL